MSKLQWKVDWAMRWYALGVDYEMCGKDLTDSVTQSGKIVQVLGGKKPEGLIYELFLDEKGEKISKSKGNGLSIDEWLTYASTESLSYFMYQKPKTAKRMFFDVIPRAMDEYHQQLQAYPTQTPEQQLANPVYHIHSGNVPESKMVVNYSMLLNLASVASAHDKSVLWGFIKNYAPDATPETHPDLDAAAGYAIKYYEDFVAPTKSYRLPTDLEREALTDLRDRLAAWEGGNDAEGLQGEVFACGRERFDPMRDWFKALYQVLLGADQGPRFGSFIALYGVDETVALIDKALAGDLVG